ncbi:MAG: T9SS type A sorting domain-containing protein [Bacteroidota bacterium]|nr:T9SS type A sorting domain-containing protein [Bacteroidota bacterium]
MSGNIFAHSIDKNSYGIINIYSATGESVWQRKFVPLSYEIGYGTYFHLYHITTGNDGYYIATGVIVDLKIKKYRSWILQIDEDGCLVPGCNDPVDVTDISIINEKPFIVFPNPNLLHSNELNILSRINSLNNSKIIIYDFSGHELIQKIFKPEKGVQYILQLNDKLPVGSYILKIVGNNFDFSEIIIIK